MANTSKGSLRTIPAHTHRNISSTRILERFITSPMPPKIQRSRPSSFSSHTLLVVLLLGLCMSERGGFGVRTHNVLLRRGIP